MKNSIVRERYLSGISLFLVLTLPVLNYGAVNSVQSKANNEGKFKNLLGRLLVARFASSSPTNSKFLRTLEESDESSESTIKTEFGPGADWSCTIPENHDYDVCTLSATGCSWCPLGSSSGVCLRNGQASLVNALENEHLLHLECYGNEDEVIDETATAFWDETASCLPHGVEDCHGVHDNGDHTCTWCTVKDPFMGLCLSQSLWDNLIVAQALEEFDEDVSTGDQIRLDQVIHCKHHHDDDDSGGDKKDGGSDSAPPTNIFNQKCGWKAIETDQDEEDCVSTEGEECAVQANPLPGLLGSKAGRFCVSLDQQHVMQWMIDLLRHMGWEDEMRAFQ
mmetsp:Transcript_563/g.1375  ORF Transcript_563/g.1375 Transcript_563/m.1375 type:complete len:336 (-) Transcript_563:286-1293(-)|eukprot:CAMPEP_0172360020 /NCGR_PEP_ID=MMETSP1060-20121228/4120_1 /TAXON_ID=37318 /ORGANISM="Pseudo-nitzschia pungens, Strain cf. cingulata" /LENGTH=335 /DNA_ID=CAMNT_0013081877 /DNA_START=118 /DNA_END=1125 /DNA_ORIENTATION=-